LPLRAEEVFTPTVGGLTPLCTDMFPITLLVALAAPVDVALAPVLGGLAPPTTDMFMLAVLVDYTVRGIGVNRRGTGATSH